MTPCLTKVQFVPLTFSAGDIGRGSISVALEHLRGHEEILGDKELSGCLRILHTHVNMLRM